MGGTLIDAIDIACRRRGRVVLRTKDGHRVSGTAVDRCSDGGDEFLVLESPRRRLLVRLRTVVSLEALDDEA